MSDLNQTIEKIMTFVKNDSTHTSGQWYDLFFECAKFHDKDDGNIDENYSYYWKECEKSFVDENTRRFNNRNYSIESMRKESSITFRNGLVEDMLHIFSEESLETILKSLYDRIWRGVVC